MKYKGNKEWAGAAESTPYQRAKQEWDSRMGDSLVRAKNWRIFATMVVLILGIAVSGLAYGFSQKRVVPYYVDVYPDGNAVSRGVVEGRYGSITEPMIRYQLRSFLEALRTISSDPEVIKNNWVYAYNMIGDSAATILDEYLRDEKTNPFLRTKDERVNSKISSFLPISKDSWEVLWEETTRTTGGNLLDVTSWKGIFHITIIEQERSELLEKNPLGLYVVDFSWTPLAQ